MCMCYDCGFSFINTLKTDNSFFTLKSKKNSSAYFSQVDIVCSTEDTFVNLMCLRKKQTAI